VAGHVFLHELIAQQPLQLCLLLRDSVRVTLFVLGTGESHRLLDQFADVANARRS
jgi:hypothetical protein